METRFIKETEMGLTISRAKTSDRGLSRWSLFGGTPVDIGHPHQIMANFGGESFQLLNPGTTSCIFCGECLISCEGPVRFKNKIHQIDRILKAVKNVPP